MSLLRAAFVSLRPHQWTKNLLVFAALVFSKHLFEADAFMRTVLAFGVFCGLSGAVYLVNDVADVERDRLHPAQEASARGQRAARAKGGAPLRGGPRPGCLAPVVRARAALPRLCRWPTSLLNLWYSFRIKNAVILDVIAISLGFVLRAVAGAVAIAVTISEWLLVCTFLLALFLALSKRRHELVSLEANATGHRAILAEYSPYLLDQMISVVTASCLVAYCFYTMAQETVVRYGTDRLSWTIPFVLYGIFRYLYLVHQKEQGGSPTDVLLTDWPLLADVALWALAVVLIVYTASGAPVPRAL